jgi:predicted flap endonuclease-1-like 5' DNA nuclease
VYNSPVERDVAAPIDYVTAEEMNAMAGQSTAPAAKSTGRGGKKAGEAASTDETVEQDVAAPIDYVTAEEVVETQEQTAPAPKSRSRGRKKGAEAASSTANTEDETVEQDVAAPIDYVTAQEVITTETVTEGDDFLRIKGVGPTYARRLKEGGFTTFAQLAAATPEEVATAMGLPVDRVRRAEVIDQAKALSQKS